MASRLKYLASAISTCAIKARGPAATRKLAKSLLLKHAGLLRLRPAESYATELMRMADQLPPNDCELPTKRYFTISEVSELCQVKAHVLRYWEQEFSLLHPQKRRGNRRYYTYEDIMLVRKIRHLLYDEGFSIVGARKQLSYPAVKKSDLDCVNKTQCEVQSVIDELQAIIDDINVK